MRTTLELDDSVVAAARSLARARRISLGAAVSELARRGMSTGQGVRADIAYAPFQVLVGDPDIIVTPELVSDLQDGE